MNTLESRALSLSKLEGMNTANDLLRMVFAQENIEKIRVPIDVEKIVNRLDEVRLTREISFSDWDKAGYIKAVRNDITHKIDHVTIWVNDSDASVRQRFTIAHELGHLIHDIIPQLDNGSKEDVIFKDQFNRGQERSLIETRANQFAAQLLMPAELVTKELKALVERLKKAEETMVLSEAIDVMAGKFEVSSQAMEIRLKALGYINS